MTADEHLAKFKRKLEVHRIRPGAEYSIKNCVTLCKPCHLPQPKSPKSKRIGRGFTIHLSPEIIQRIDAYRAALPVKVSRTAVILAGLDLLLIQEGYPPSGD